MKKIFITAFLGLVIFTSFNMVMEPVEYNNAIINEQDKISKAMLDMVGNFETDLNKANLYREVLTMQCERSIEATKKLPPYDGSTKFRDAGVDMYTFYKEISEKEYREVIGILKKGNKITEADIADLTIIEQKITSKEILLDEAFSVAQKEFAEKYNLRLEENKMQQEIDKVGK